MCAPRPQVPAAVDVCLAILASSPQLLVEQAPALLRLDKQLLAGLARVSRWVPGQWAAAPQAVLQAVAAAAAERRR
jgi:hypothetical protein